MVNAMGHKAFLLASVSLVLVAGCAPAQQEQRGIDPSAAVQPATATRSLGTQEGVRALTFCPGLRDHVDKAGSPLVIISDGPLPGPTSDRAPTDSEVKCVESLRAAGKKAIEEGKVTQGVTQYLAAVDVAPALAGDTYLELAHALDKGANPQAALAAFFKAWKALEISHNRPGVKFGGPAVLMMADIRDSILRLGGQVPSPTSEPGRIAFSTPTRQLQEQYLSPLPTR